MKDVRMTDIIVSTPAFIVTLTTPSKISGLNEEALLEVTPLREKLAEQFFSILTADTTKHNRKSKKRNLDDFIAQSTQKIVEEFWENVNLKPLQRLSFRWPSVICVLYDKAGDVKKTVLSLSVDLWTTLQQIEEALFERTLPLARWVVAQEVKKDLRRHSNRQTHKYFLHHRHR